MLVFEGGSNIFRYISLLPHRNVRGGGGRGRVGLGPRHFAIRRGGGVVGSRRGCREQGEEGRVLPSSRRGCVDVEIERGGRILPSSRRRCQDRERRRGEPPPHAVDVEIERGGESSPLLVPWMSRSREEGKNPSSRRGCQDREGRGEYSPPRAVDIENKKRRGEFSPPRAVDVEIERGGEKPLLTPWL